MVIRELTRWQKRLKNFLYDTRAKRIATCKNCPEVKSPQKTNFTLKPLKSSRMSELVQIDHIKLSLLSTGYKHSLVLFGHYPKQAGAVP